jgi:hypothetical protein
VRAIAARAEGAARAAAADARAAAGRRLRAEEVAREALRLHHAAWHAGARCEPGPVPVAAALAEGAAFEARSAREEARLAAALVRCEAEHEAACAEAERRRVVHADALGALRGLDRRRLAWRAARAGDRARAEEDASDELVSARWGGGG